MSVWLRVGGTMLVKIASVLLVVWALGLLGVYEIGKLFHMFLLVGLMLLLMAVARAREEAFRGPDPGGEK